MAEKSPIKFTEEELKQLKNLQTKVDQIIISLGQISLQRTQLDKLEETTKEQFHLLKDQEVALGEEFSKKYGVGTLDINSGEFIPQS
tara:strand:+ start:127 stop:387 length:261 start_codon:yes stop_codon:yes gene_type:complete